MDGSKTESRNDKFVGHDAKPIVRKIERVREWEHDGEPSCPRKSRPVFTPPGELPRPCGQTKDGQDYYACGKDEWRSKGIVLRDEDKRVVGREK